MRLRASTRSAGIVDAITAPQRSCRDGLGTGMGREGRRRALEPLGAAPPGDAPCRSGRRSVRHCPSAALARAHYVEESSDRPGGAVPGLDQAPYDATAAGVLAD